MIICSCNVISDKEIKAAVEELVGSDPDVVLTPGMVYRALCCRPKCGTCLQQVVKMMHDHRESMQCDCQTRRTAKNATMSAPRQRSNRTRAQADSGVDMTPKTI